jgi:predicted O-methyltransferase YrrM
MIKKIKNKFSLLNKIATKIDHNSIIVGESIAATQVYSLLNDVSYMPFSKSSLNFTSMAILLNDIVINDRKLIVEFGSGISTILIAQLIKKNKLEGVKLISVEHNTEWLQVVDSLLKSNSLDGIVELVYSPLVANEMSLDNTKWYSTEPILLKIKENKNSVDCVLVDGPEAWYDEISRSRYPALPFIIDYLGDNAILFLDDTNRKGEIDILMKWKTYGMREIRFGDTFTGLIKGKIFTIN